MIYLTIFGASFLYVGLRAFQQLNVVHDNKLAVLPTSFGMAVVDVYLIRQFIQYEYAYIVVALGLGAGLGCLTSMHLHKRWGMNKR